MVERDGRNGDGAGPADPHAPTERSVTRVPKDRDETDKLPFKGRVTMNFTGPPLSLPADADEGPIDREPLELDTSELRPPEEKAAPSAARKGPRLDLDLDGLEAPVEPRAHDAWVVDKQRRSTPPPRPWTQPIAPPPIRPSSPAERMPEGTGDALGLVDRARPSATEIDLVAEMGDRFGLGDFTGALRAAELVLGADPSNPQARQYAEASRARLEALHVSRLGALDRVPRLSVAESDIRWLGLDHRAAFLLSRIDGRHTFEELLDLSAMPRLEALKTLVELLDAGVIRVDVPS